MSRQVSAANFSEEPILPIVTNQQQEQFRQRWLIYDIIAVIAEFAEDQHILHAMCLTHPEWYKQVIQTNNYQTLKQVLIFFRNLPRNSVLYELEKELHCDKLHAVIHSEKLLAFFPGSKFSSNHFFNILNQQDGPNERLKKLQVLFNEALGKNNSTEFSRLQNKFRKYYCPVFYLLTKAITECFGIYYLFIVPSKEDLSTGCPLSPFTMKVFLLGLVAVCLLIPWIGICVDIYNARKLANTEGQWKKIKKGTLETITDFFYARKPWQSFESNLCIISKKPHGSP